MKRVGLLLAGAAVSLAMFAMPTASIAQEATYGDKLGLIPVSNTNRRSIGGTGAVNATLSGTSLNIEGTYRGLAADATGVGVYAGAAGVMGGDKIGEATLIETVAASGTEGSFSGTVELTAEQVEALNDNALFVVVQTAANPTGEIRGWLVAGNTGVDTAVN